MKSTREIIAKIASFTPVDGNWFRLDELVEELWKSKNPELAIKSLFEVFERYPKDDGAGVFWTVLHGLETLRYEAFLYDSLLRKSSHMGIIMLNRIENNGSKYIAGKSIIELKEYIKNNPKVNSELVSEL